MKRIIAIILTSCILLACTGMALADTYIVNTVTDPLLVRDKYDSNIIYGQYPKGCKVDILYTDDWWAYLIYDGHEAKMYKPLLLKESNSPSQVAPSIPANTSNAKSTYKAPVPAKPATTNDASMIFTLKEDAPDTVNIYLEKAYNSEVLGTLSHENLIFVRNYGKAWCRIVYRDRFAYVPTKYLAPHSLNLPEEGVSFKVIVGDGFTLNVREQPSLDAKTITRIPNGAYIKVVEEGEEWSHIFYSPTDSGYVKNSYINASQFE